jgi:hypothetical protein
MSKGRIIGITTKDAWKNDKGQTFPEGATVYVVCNNKGDNSIGERGVELKLTANDPVYTDLFLGTNTLGHSIGAVLDFSTEGTKYGTTKLTDCELVSYIDSNGEVVKYDPEGDELPLYQAKEKIKASA